MTHKNHTTTMNRILNNEMAAAKLYEDLLDLGGNARDVWSFQEIAEDHRQAVGLIKQQIADMGVEADPHGTTDVWLGVKRNQELMILEDRVLLTALRSREALQAETCRHTMAVEGPESPGHKLISSRIVPMLEVHVATLDSYLA